MTILRQIFITSVLTIGLTFSGLTLAATISGGTVSGPNHWVLDGTNLVPVDSTYTLGTSGTPIIDGEFTSLTIGAITISGAISGDLFIANDAGLTVGHTAQITVGALLSEFQVLGTSGADSSMIIHRASANSSPAQLFFAKGRDAIGGTTTALADNDDIANIRFYGSDGTDFGSYAAEIMVSVDAATGNNDLPGRMIFSTTADGDASPTERLRIDSAGLITITGSQTISLTLGVTGNVDFGSATSTEITNSAAPFLDAAGEIAVDTTDDQLIYYGGAKRVLTYKYNKSVVLDAPVDADTWLLWKPQDNITITDIFCITDPTDGTGETLIIDIRETDSSGDSGTTVDATITCDSDGAEDDGALSNGTIDAGDWVQIDIGAASGTIPVVTVDIWYTIDAE